MLIYVNIYRVGRSYGGPEEGGWYFDTGTPIGAVPITVTEEERTAIWNTAERHDKDFDYYLSDYLKKKAEAEAQRHRVFFPRTNKRSSVLGGEDYDVLIEDSFPQPFPKERPHYE